MSRQTTLEEMAALVKEAAKPWMLSIGGRMGIAHGAWNAIAAAVMQHYRTAEPDACPRCTSTVKDERGAVAGPGGQFTGPCTHEWHGDEESEGKDVTMPVMGFVDRDACAACNGVSQTHHPRCPTLFSSDPDPEPNHS